MQTRRLLVAFGWGVGATLAMSTLMILGVVTGVAPMPKPIPVAFIAQTFGPLPRPVLIPIAFLTHLVYGGVAAALLAALTRPVTVRKGAGWGVVLWALMGVTSLPYLGWGAFGAAETPKIALATLLLHLVYGLTLGATMSRSDLANAPRQGEHESAPGRGATPQASNER